MLPSRAIVACLLLLATLSALAAPTASQDADYDARVHFDGPTPSYEGPVGLMVLASSQAGEAYSWRLDLEKEYTIIEIGVDSGFDVQRPMQVVPELDDSRQHPDAEHLHPHYFQPLMFSDVTAVDRPARVYNLTGDVSGFTYRLGLPGPGEATLHLRRDVTPPAFTIDEPTDISHIGFLLKTTTDEFAFGNVLVERPNGEVIEFPTPLPSLHQDYPVQGLEADTPHNVTVVMRDWSGNEATAEAFEVRTAPEPERPLPEVEAVAPLPEAAVDGPNVAIEARVTSPLSAVTADGVRLFVDKQEVYDGFTFDGETLTILVGPLEPGLHSVSVEATNLAGGKGHVAWTFTVNEERGAPGPALGVVVLAVVAVAALAARRN